MKITIAQVNPVVGDIDGNFKKMEEVMAEHAAGSDLVIFPELFLTGYPPRDLLEKPGFIKRTRGIVKELSMLTMKHPETGMLFGMPIPTGKDSGRGLYNSAVLMHKGNIIAEQHKSLLPVYDVFDEIRYFDPSPEVIVVPFKKERLGITICEDMWNNTELWGGRPYAFDPVEKLARSRSTILINISASPFYTGKDVIRYNLIHDHAKRYGLPFIFVNQVGGNDELIFDGRSMCVDGEGKLISVFPSFKEHIETIDLNAPELGPGTDDGYMPQDDEYIPKDEGYVRQNEVESIHDALALGIRDYMNKCGFEKAVIGLSGGIDSAVTCCLARDAVGSKNVLAVSMPSPYSSLESAEYARKLAGHLGIKYEEINISEVYNSYNQTLRNIPELINEHEGVGVHLQNIQARIRGNILMAFSNRFGHLLLTTGNKSEMAVGYCTLYGDMAGGLAVISDVPKTMVYKIAEYINRDEEIIPRWIIDRPPSAELKPYQLDQDTLPPYDVLDKILYHYLEEGFTRNKLLKKGFDEDTVNWVINAVNTNEYKRRQAPPGLKVTSKAFGIGRRMPIAAKYYE